jgi:transposase InsO family protein
VKAALAYYASLGVTVERVMMTDNGSCYKSFAFRRACKRLGLKHVLTKPYTPKTNGNAERFIQNSLREWAYARAYQHSRQRREQLAPGSIVTIGIAHTPASVPRYLSADSE